MDHTICQVMLEFLGLSDYADEIIPVKETRVGVDSPTKKATKQEKKTALSMSTAIGNDDL